MNYKKGDKVKIIRASQYVVHGIPSSLLKHGTYTLGNEPNATVVDTYNEYVIVNYINDGDKKMQLGFLPNNLELIESSNEITNSYLIY